MATDAAEPSIRLARDGDAQDLFGLLALCFAEFRGCYVDPHGDLADLRASGRAFSDGGGAFWVMEDEGGRICSCVAVGHPKPRVAEMHRLYVRPDRRRTGLGARLVRLVEDHAGARDSARIVFWSDLRFTGAHRLYERLGYRATGRTRDLGDISNSTEMRFEKALG